MFERRAEEFSLTNRRDAANNDDHSGMQWFSAMERARKSERLFVTNVYSCWRIVP